MRYFDFINFFRDSFEWIISDEENQKMQHKFKLITMNLN